MFCKLHHNSKTVCLLLVHLNMEKLSTPDLMNMAVQFFPYKGQHSFHQTSDSFKYPYMKGLLSSTDILKTQHFTFSPKNNLRT